MFAGRYVARQKSRIAAAGQRADAGLVAADLAAQRAVAEHRLLEQDLGVLGRVVEVRADLLDDDRPLAVDLVVVERRPDDQLAEDVHRRARPRDAGTRTQYTVDSRSVAALNEPPTPSIASRDRPGRRDSAAVPLNVRCSMKWATPACSGALEARPGQDVRGDRDRTRARAAGR